MTEILREIERAQALDPVEAVRVLVELDRRGLLSRGRELSVRARTLSAARRRDVRSWVRRWPQERVHRQWARAMSQLRGFQDTEGRPIIQGEQAVDVILRAEARQGDVLTIKDDGTVSVANGSPGEVFLGVAQRSDAGTVVIRVAGPSAVSPGLLRVRGPWRVEEVLEAPEVRPWRADPPAFAPPTKAQRAREKTRENVRRRPPRSLR